MNHICAILSCTGKNEQAILALSAVAEQSRKPDSIVVCSCAPAPITDSLLSQAQARFGSNQWHGIHCPPGTDVAGCFKAGVDYAFSRLDADFVWEIDENCHPAPDCLQQLEKAGSSTPAILCPTIRDAENNVEPGTPPRFIPSGSLYPREAYLRSNGPNEQLIMQGVRENWVMNLQELGILVHTVSGASTAFAAACQHLIRYQHGGRDFFYLTGKTEEEHYYCMRNRAWTDRQLHRKHYLRRLVSCGIYMLNTLRAMIQANEVSLKRIYLVFRGQHNGFYGKLRPY